MTCPPINICQLSFCTSNVFCNNCAVMVSATPCGILLHSMVIHASANRFLACVKREWLQVIRAVICELRRGFLGSSFHVNCLGHALHDDKAKQRLQRVLNIRFGNAIIPDLTVWWYNTQLYLQDTIRKKSDVLPRAFTLLLPFLCVRRVRLRNVQRSLP